MKHAKELTIIKPIVTEKAAMLAEQGCYMFEVHKDANKAEIAAAIIATYKVTPRIIRVSIESKKPVRTRGTNRVGSTGGAKKAYVCLKAGDTITLA